MISAHHGHGGWDQETGAKGTRTQPSAEPAPAALWGHAAGRSSRSGDPRPLPGRSPSPSAACAFLPPPLVQGVGPARGKTQGWGPCAGEGAQLGHIWPERKGPNGTEGRPFIPKGKGGGGWP